MISDDLRTLTGAAWLLLSALDRRPLALMFLPELEDRVSLGDEIVRQDRGHLEHAADTIQMKGHALEFPWRLFHDADLHGLVIGWGG